MKIRGSNLCLTGRNDDQLLPNQIRKYCHGDHFKTLLHVGALLTGAAPRPSIASLKALGYQSPNEKLNVAGIGAGGQPLSDLRACQGENIVALADVDWMRGEQGFKRFQKATKYKDFRQMLDKEGKNIDAVVIGTPDHMHATARSPACRRARAFTSKNR